MKQHRSLFIRGIVAAVLATAALSAAGVGASAADWPKYLRDVGSSGFTPDRTITAGTAASLKLPAGWPVRLGDRPITTQPIVANGRVSPAAVTLGDDAAVTRGVQTARAVAPAVLLRRERSHAFGSILGAGRRGTS